jgi:hypothetical protein
MLFVFITEGTFTCDQVDYRTMPAIGAFERFAEQIPAILAARARASPLAPILITRFGIDVLALILTFTSKGAR